MEIAIQRPTTRTRRLLVSALAATLLLTVTPPVRADYSSGDHPGCVTGVRAHFDQEATPNGLVTFYLETWGSYDYWKIWGHNMHITRTGYWPGTAWRLSGWHPGTTGYLTCT